MTFASNTITTDNKEKFYSLLAQQAEGLLQLETDLIANAANLASLLYHALDKVNWVGFYLLQNDELVLGPFQGQVACTRIPLGQGVCGTALQQNKTQRVADVNAFAGHIACDSASQSELVIPIRLGHHCIGVLDIDSPVHNRFGVEDQLGCEKIVQVFEQALMHNTLG